MQTRKRDVAVCRQRSATSPLNQAPRTCPTSQPTAHRDCD